MTSRGRRSARRRRARKQRGGTRSGAEAQFADGDSFEYRSCQRKSSYPSERAARLVAGRNEESTFERTGTFTPLWTYECRFGKKHFHITRREQGRRVPSRNVDGTNED